LIAPVLARLDELKPSPGAEFDRSGGLMRVAPGSDSERLRAVLRGRGLKLEETGEDLSAAVWYSRANIVELSREEFRILARGSAGRVPELTSEEQRRLVVSIDGAMDAALALVSVEGGFRPEWTAAKLKARGQIIEDAAAYLQPVQLAGLRQALAWTIGRPG
jgi:hypothetical protein